MGTVTTGRNLEHAVATWGMVGLHGLGRGYMDHDKGRGDHGVDS